jgi:hypothetical protein
MHHIKIALVILVLLSVACSRTDITDTKKDIAMTDQILVVKAACRGNEQCLFDGKEMFLDINITNNRETAIGFPLEYARKKGPIVKLVDTRTKAETFLRPNLADTALMGKFTTIQPGQSVSIEWVITAFELEQFNKSRVDLSAEFTIMVDLLIEDKIVSFKGFDTLRIVSKS